ncbi:SGNH/GDSL hydrolase family protein, partial [Spirillospora sp. NPDC049652]
LPSMAAALALDPDQDLLPDARRGEGVLPVYLAAVEAAEKPGTEVSGTRVAGHDRGPRGRWATLLRRVRRTPPPSLAESDAA